MDWRLRRAEPGDEPALSLVAAASFLDAFAGVLAGPDIVAHVTRNSSVEKFATWIADSDSIVAIAEHPNGAAPVGYTVLTPPDFPIPTGPDDVELRRIYTMPVANGTGLGALLMKRAIADARALGRKRMLLGVLGTNNRARHFYERQGFALAGERRFNVGGSWYDDVVYARDL
ncbi:GNAT family N-acetyltransferase [Sphingomonas lenta]|nr:GNAT family N-acetyltransferase [Sphingomonas lenta]